MLFAGLVIFKQLMS